MSFPKSLVSRKNSCPGFRWTCSLTFYELCRLLQGGLTNWFRGRWLRVILIILLNPGMTSEWVARTTADVITPRNLATLALKYPTYTIPRVATRNLLSSRLPGKSSFFQFPALLHYATFTERPILAVAAYPISTSITLPCQISFPL